MFYFENNNEKVGAYLKKLIEKKYESHRKFCKAYIEAQGFEATDEELRKMANRISQILKGSKSIQTRDLPFFTDLLGVSCEEILSAGKTFVPISGHVTNYEIAHSHDKTMWEKYLQNKDNVFINLDEYGMSVIDYALEYKNYGFIKYLMDEKYIWFVDNSNCNGLSFGAGTSIKMRNVSRLGLAHPNQMIYEEYLRTQVIALAIENDDFQILDSLLAREVPTLYDATYYGYPYKDLNSFRNDNLIEAVANGSQSVLDYFSKEFVTNKFNNPKFKQNTFIYPYLGDVINLMLNSGRNEAEILIRRAIIHNKDTYNKIKDLMKLRYEHLLSSYDYELPDNLKANAWEQSLLYFNYNEKTDMIWYNYCIGKNNTVGMITNIIKVTAKPKDLLLDLLVKELNEWYEKVINLKEGLD